MADKKKANFVVPEDVANAFDDDYDIFKFRPVIEYIEPDQLKDTQAAEEPETIDSFRDRATSLKTNLEALGKLFDATQEKIDNRVRTGGGFTAKLDRVNDAATIAAMKRRFPDKADPTQVSYDDYKQALNCLNESTIPPLGPTAEDIRQAKADPLRTDFGGINNQNGENRPEISSPLNSIKPIDTESFQKSAVIALFALMLPMIQSQTSSQIAVHLASAPHGA